MIYVCFLVVFCSRLNKLPSAICKLTINKLIIIIKVVIVEHIKGTKKAGLASLGIFHASYNIRITLSTIKITLPFIKMNILFSKRHGRSLINRCKAFELYP